MPEKIIIDYCSPTLAGIKTGSLFRLRFDDEVTVRTEIEQLDQCFQQKGLRAVPLRFTESHVLLYIYRPSYLLRDMNVRTAHAVLKELGYSCTAPEEDIARLAEKVQFDDEFPHEIGFFLGYPPEDVIGFMKHRNEGVKCTGLWKVYGDVAKANHLFAQYRKCTRLYASLWEKGRSIDQLTVKI